LQSVAKNYGIEVVSLIAPTSEDRIKTIASDAEGFVYVVSSLGVTGVRSEIQTDLDTITKSVKSVTDIPVAIGFGINTPEQAKKYSDIADGVIVGSAIVKLIEQYAEDAPQKVYDYVKSMKDAIR
jgi:tryptophan synthase alpha chain